MWADFDAGKLVDAVPICFADIYPVLLDTGWAKPEVCRHLQPIRG
jgi:hypothetical protein